MLPHGDRGCEEAGGQKARYGTARDRRTEGKGRRLSFPALRWTEAACGNRKSSCQYAEDPTV